ncbi:MAG: DMT family transporter [Gammaproteobacteria bacterium]|nr:DMT family transporter [Gammaproteobacteria bacterium]
MINWICTIFLGTLGWGVSLFLIKILLKSLTPTEIVLYRMIIGSFILFILIKILDFKISQKKYLLRDGFVLALFNIVIPFYLTTYAEKSVTSSLASVVNGLTPIFTFMLGIIFIPSQRQINWINFLSVLMGFTGIIIMNFSDPYHSDNLIYFIALIVASFSYAIAANYVKTFAKIKNPILLSTAAAFFSVVLMLLYKLMTVERFNWHLPQNSQEIMALLWLGSVGSGISLYLYCLLIQRNGAVNASMVTYLMLVTGVLAGTLFLNEPLSAMVIFGCICTVFSIILINHSSWLTRKFSQLYK